MEIKAIYVSYYSKFVLHHVMMRDNFKALDTDNDGIITRDEIFEAKYFKEGKITLPHRHIVLHIVVVMSLLSQPYKKR
jgi:hypothetical protein